MSADTSPDDTPSEAPEPIPTPQVGGSYAYDPETNTLTRRESDE